MSFTQLYIMYIRIRCNFRLEVYNRNTNHCPTMVTSRQPVNVPTPNHSFTHSPFKCCSKHLNPPTQSRLARDHHKSTKTITKMYTWALNNGSLAQRMYTWALKRQAGSKKPRKKEIASHGQSMSQKSEKGSLQAQGSVN